MFFLPWFGLWVQTSDLLENSDKGDFLEDDRAVSFGELLFCFIFEARSPVGKAGIKPNV